MVLAHLLLNALAGTSDEIGTNLAPYRRKVEAILGGTYGSWRRSSSFILEGSPAPAAILVTDYAAYGGPTIAVIAVSPDRQRAGLATFLLRSSLAALYDEGEHACFAAISPGNHQSEALFSRVGFSPVS